MKKYLIFSLFFVSLLFCSCKKNISKSDNISEGDILLLGTSVSSKTDGVTVNGSKIIISKGGVYNLSGKFAGNIVVEASKDDTVTLNLNGAEITSSENSAIFSKSGILILNLLENTENILSDSKNYTETDADSTLCSKDSLSIMGTGSLTIDASYCNAISCRDILTINSGAINITAVDSGIIGRDNVVINGGIININSLGTGIKSTNKNSGKGNIIVSGGNITVISDADGIKSENDILLESGNITITTGGGAGNSAMHEKNFKRTEETTDTISMKALKSGGKLTINDGVLKLDSVDDALHSSGTITLNGGTITLSSGDDAIHSDGIINLIGSYVNILKSYEGMEGASIAISGGELNLVSYDDGINIAGGNDKNSGGFGGKDSFKTEADNALTIASGKINIDAGGDGIDANGTVIISGGDIVVAGPTDNGNGIIDYFNSFAVNGGTFTAYGSSGMLQSPTDNSLQCVLVCTFTSKMPSGKVYYITDKNNNVIWSFKSQKEFTSLIISSPSFKKAENFLLFIGGNTKDITLGKPYEHGTKLTDILFSSNITAINLSIDKEIQGNQNNESTINRDPRKAEKPIGADNPNHLTPPVKNDENPVPVPPSEDDYFPSSPDTSAGYGDNDISIPSDWEM